MHKKLMGIRVLIAASSVVLGTTSASAQPSGGSPSRGGAGDGSPSTPPQHARVNEIMADREIDWQNPQHRAQAAEQIRAVEKTNLERARTRAAARGIPMREVEPDGTVSEIVGLDENDEFIIYTTHNTKAGISSGANLLHEAPFGLDGSGVIVGVWDVNRPRFTHQEFGRRVTVHDGAEGQDTHHTHVAGTIGAKGVDPAARGMATNVLIHSRHWGVDASTMIANAATEPRQADKLYISNHSYGRHAGWRLRSEGWTWEGVGTDQDAYDPIYGRYDDMASSWDSIAYNAPYYLIFRSAGNSNDHNPTPGEDVRIDDEWVEYDPAIHPPGDGANGFANIAASANAKNVMVVGATTNAVSDGMRDPSRAGLGEFSSRGPTDDGRIKPDIVANGVNVYSATSASDSSYAARSGTSMSSPSAAGSAALLVQLYRDSFSGGAMRASTLKGLIIHTATDLGAYGLGNPGPDYRYGWGLINVHQAAELLMDHKENPSKRRLREDVLSTSVPARTYEFEWDGASPIRATLSWTDPAGSSTSEHNSRTPRLVNDLDLKIIAPDGTEYLPWVMPYVVSDDPDIQWQVVGMSEPATTGTNSTDNVEQVLIDDPQQAGTWQIEITHKGSLTNGEQAYGLLLSGVAGDPDELIFHSVSPYEADEGSVVTIDITGSGLSADTTIKMQKAGEPDIPGTSVEMIGNTLRCEFDLSGVSLGAWDVVATNPDEQTHTLVGAFTVNIFGNVLFEEDFTGSDTLPDGWSQEELVGSGASWTVRNGAGSGFNPRDAYSGSRNVTLFTSNESDNIVRLYTPALNLSGYEDVVLRFQHHMQVWEGSQDELSVLYSTDGGESWNLLEEYTDNVDNWTLRKLPLPSPGGNYMIAFEGNALYGFGICIDDVEVVAYGDFTPTPGQLSVTPAEDVVASGMAGGPFDPESQVYTLSNIGSEPLGWQVSNLEDWVSISSPTNGALSSGESATVTVSINSAAESLALGSHQDTVTFANTTNSEGTTTRSVSLAVLESYTVSYDGNQHTGGSAPAPQIKLDGIPLTLASNTGELMRTDFDFVGWNTQADGNGIHYAEGASYTDDADVTLYAQWNRSPAVDAGPDQTVYLAGHIPWTPANVTSVVAWYDAADESTLTIEEGRVSEWRDKSVNERNISRDAAGDRPWYLANDPMVNNLPSIGTNVISGNIGLVSPSSFAVRNAYAVAYYMDGTVDSTAGGQYPTLLSGAGSHGYERIMLNQNSDQLIGTGAFATGGIYRNGATGSSTSMLPMPATVWRFESNNTRTHPWAIGYNRESDNRTWPGGISEWIFTDGTEDLATKQKIEGYLAHKWGLEDHLPSDHPYRNEAPGIPAATAVLAGSATDPDGDSLTTLWAKEGGPDAPVTFADASSIGTTATFFEEGVYTLRLMANDGFAQAFDEVVITVTNLLTVTYNGNNATDGEVPVDSNLYEPGDSVTVAGNTGELIREGYTFAGWNTQADGNGTPYASGNNFIINENVTLYAQWTANTYTVTLDRQEGTGGSASIQASFGSAMPSADAPTRDGYTFAGYYAEINGGGTQYYHADMSSAHDWDIANDATLYASWSSPPEVDAGPDQTVYMSGAGDDWTPAEIDAAAWYDASDSESLTVDAGAVSQWNDKSGNDYHLTQGNSVRQPTLGTDEVQMPAGQFMSVTPGMMPTGSGGRHIFAVVNQTSTDGDAFIAQQVSGWNSLRGFRITGEPAVRYHGSTFYNDGGGTLDAGDSIIAVLYDSGANAADIRYVVDGDARTATSGTTSPLAANDTGLFVGCDYFTGVKADDGAANFREILVFTNAVMGAEMQASVEGYLAHKWGLEDHLPSNHPYKDSGPNAASAIATLTGYASDPDGDPLTTQWTMVDGPDAGVTFADPSITNTTATFFQEGTYTLRLTADNGFQQAYDDVVIAVEVHSDDYQSWLQEHYGDPDYDDSQMAASGVHTIRQAYVAGLIPTNATARFVIDNAEMDTAERVLRWTGVEGRRYRVYWSSNLLHGAGFEPIATNIHWSIGAYTDTVERTSSESFYRIGVELEE